MRLGVNLPGPFWASFNVPLRGRRGRGSGGCLSVLGSLILWPFILLYWLVVGVAKLYRYAWNTPTTRLGKIMSVSGVSVALFALLVIVSVAGGGSSSTGSTTQTAVTATTPTPRQSVVAVTATPTPTRAKDTPRVTPSSVATTERAAAPTTSATTPTTQAPAPTSQAPAPSTPAAQPSCYPTTSSGNCYEPGEFCPKADHNQSGVAADGESISCEYDNGYWRWLAK